MNKQVIVLISVLLFSGCDAIKAPMVENSLQSAIDSGDVEEQLSAIDQLSEIAPEQYQHLAETKEQLLPFIYQLMDAPKNISGIKDTVLTDIIEFAPNYDGLSYAKQYLIKKRQLTKAVNESIDEVNKHKAILKEALKVTPSHMQTYQTNMMISDMAPYLLLSDFAKNIQRSLGKAPLTGYQIKTFATQLSSIYNANEKLMASTFALNTLSHQSQAQIQSVQAKENQDITQLMLWLYKKQLLVSYHDLVTQNEYLLSLLNNQLGVQSMDNVWLTIVEPVAKELVLERKETQLNVLNMLALKLDKMSAHYPRFHGIYAEHDKIEKLMLSLLWPQNGLVNFESSSSKNTKQLWNEINNKQQL